MSLSKKGKLVILEDFEMVKITKNKTRWDTDTPTGKEPFYIHRGDMPDWCEFDEDNNMTNGDLTRVVYEFTPTDESVLVEDDAPIE